MKQEEEEVMMENNVEEGVVMVVDESTSSLPCDDVWQSYFFVVDKVLKILANSCTNTCLYTCN